MIHKYNTEFLAPESGDNGEHIDGMWRRERIHETPVGGTAFVQLSLSV